MDCSTAAVDIGVSIFWTVVKSAPLYLCVCPCKDVCVCVCVFFFFFFRPRALTMEKRASSIERGFVGCRSAASRMLLSKC